MSHDKKMDEVYDLDRFLYSISMHFVLQPSDINLEENDALDID